MEQTDDIEKQIELKRLEIEKLKLEKELQTNTASTLMQQEVVTVKDAYPNRIVLNIAILIVASITFYLLPWGSLNSSYNTNFGGGGSSMSFTGFNIGLFTYSYPLTLVNIVLLILIALNKLKPVGIVGIVALIISLVAVANASDFSKLSAGYSSQFGSVSAGIKSTGWCYILPVCYAIITILNVTQKKVSSRAYNAIGSAVDNTYEPTPVVYYNIGDWSTNIQLSKSNFHFSLLSFLISMVFFFTTQHQTIIVGAALILSFLCLMHYYQRRKFINEVAEGEILNFQQLLLFNIVVCGIIYILTAYTAYEVVKLFYTYNSKDTFIAQGVMKSQFDIYRLKPYSGYLEFAAIIVNLVLYTLNVGIAIVRYNLFTFNKI